jgi:hypothetical protein
MENSQEQSKPDEKVTHFVAVDSDVYQDEEDAKEFSDMLDKAEASQTRNRAAE